MKQLRSSLSNPQRRAAIPGLHRPRLARVCAAVVRPVASAQHTPEQFAVLNGGENCLLSADAAERPTNANGVREAILCRRFNAHSSAVSSALVTNDNEGMRSETRSWASVLWFRTLVACGLRSLCLQSTSSVLFSLQSPRSWSQPALTRPWRIGPCAG